MAHQTSGESHLICATMTKSSTRIVSNNMDSYICPVCSSTSTTIHLARSHVITHFQRSRTSKQRKKYVFLDDEENFKLRDLVLDLYPGRDYALERWTRSSVRDWIDTQQHDKFLIPPLFDFFHELIFFGPGMWQGQIVARQSRVPLWRTHRASKRTQQGNQTQNFSAPLKIVSRWEICLLHRHIVARDDPRAFQITRAKMWSRRSFPRPCQWNTISSSKWFVQTRRFGYQDSCGRLFSSILREVWDNIGRLGIGCPQMGIWCRRPRAVSQRQASLQTHW